MKKHDKVDFERYRVKKAVALRLRTINPEDRSAFQGGKEKAEKILEQNLEQLSRLQELLYATHAYKILIVLQGMDTSGKDGVIKHLFKGVNPQGVRVTCFKAPSADELDRDYLWRVHNAVPAKGQIAIFNRSHYEDVLVPLVRDLVSVSLIRKRYEHIKAFEKELSDEGAIILKFFIHIDQEEQKVRLQERLDDPAKQWKFNVDDLNTRGLWNDYMRAYEKAIQATSRQYAPWYVIPANRNWYRNLIISSVIVEKLSSLGMKFPALRAKKDILIP
ncbi:MAG: PPK2 family polyphosphate kinase [Candidatus Omnitrophota bacterium]